MRAIVTGCAGFIGYHLCKRLLGEGFEVIGIDNINAYYDTALKNARLVRLGDLKYTGLNTDLGGVSDNFKFYKDDITDHDRLGEIFYENNIGDKDYVVHLAAQAGIARIFTAPLEYINTNIKGFFNILEVCSGRFKPKHVLYASSSSVYGANQGIVSECDNVSHPVSLYGVSKKANELLAHAYAHTYNLPLTGMRFFSVYGPWGRPDMALSIFIKAIFAGERITLFNHGHMYRSFTYVDDIIESVFRLLDCIPESNPAWDPTKPDRSISEHPYQVYNIGGYSAITLRDFVTLIEEVTGKKALVDLAPMRKCDIEGFRADSDNLLARIGYAPSTEMVEGVRKYVEWHKDYYNIG